MFADPKNTLGSLPGPAGKRHAVFFLSLVSVFNFIGDIMYIAGDLQKDASMKVYYFFAVLFLVMYTGAAVPSLIILPTAMLSLHC